jgi:hypothetical protein
VGQLSNWDLFREIVTSIGATFSIMWCMWIVHAFRSIIGWWAHMHDQMVSVNQLLLEAKQDLKDLKSIKSEK